MTTPEERLNCLDWYRFVLGSSANGACILFCVARFPDGTEEFVERKGHSQDGTHVEESALKRIQVFCDGKGKQPKSVTFYSNESPCAACAEKITSFVSRLDICSFVIRCTSLYQSEGEENVEGLLALVRNNVKVAIFDENDWFFLAKKSGQMWQMKRHIEERKEMDEKWRQRLKEIQDMVAERHKFQERDHRFDEELESPGSSALHLASWNKNAEILSLLLQSNSFSHLINSTNKSGWSPLHVASRYGKTDHAQLLLRAGVDAGLLTPQGNSVLHLASRNDQHAVLSELMQSEKCRCFLNTANKVGWTPVHIAVRHGRQEHVKLLVQGGSHVSMRTNDGSTVLHLGAWNENPETLSEVMKYNQHSELLNVLDEDGWSPLHIAARKGKSEHVRLLLSEGCETSLKTKDGSSILHLASLNENWDILQELLLEVKDTQLLFSVNKVGWTPLHVAVRIGRKEHVRLLVEAGSDTECLTTDRNSVLHLACWNKNPEALVYLLENRSDSLNVVNKIGWTALHVAVRQGKREHLKSLIDSGADITSLTTDTNSVLHLSCWNEYWEVLDELLQKKEVHPLLDSVNSSGWSPIHVAVRHGRREHVKLLLKAGCDRKSLTPDGSCVYHLAIENDNTDVLDELLRRNENKELLDVANKSSWTPLHVAVRIGKKEHVKMLLKAGCDTSVETNDNSSVLHLACLNENWDILEELLNSKVSSELLKTVNKVGWTPLHIAVRVGKKEHVRLLLEAGSEGTLLTTDKNSVLHLASWNKNHDALRELLLHEDILQLLDTTNKIGWTSFHVAVRQGKEEHMQLLVEAGCDVLRATGDGNTALHLACWNEGTDILSKLLQNRAIKTLLNTTNFLGWTPLHGAVRKGRKDHVSLLLETGCDAKVVDNDGNSIMHLASQNLDSEILQRLLSVEDSAALLASVNNTGWTPLSLAARKAKKEHVKLLLEAGCDVTHVTQDGNSVLHLAALNEDWEVTKELLRWSASSQVLNSTNHEGWTPFHIATRYGAREHVQMLLDAGCNAALLIHASQSNDRMPFSVANSFAISTQSLSSVVT